MAATVDQNEVGAEEGRETVGVVSGYRQTAALFGAVGRKRPNDDAPARLERLFEPLEIGALFLFACQEVEGGAIVPNVVDFRWSPFRCVGDDPFHRIAFLAKPSAHRIERRSGQVQDGDIFEALRQKVIDKTGCAAADVYDGRRQLCVDEFQQLEGFGGNLLEPTNFGFALIGVDVLPMRSPSGRFHRCP